MWQSPVLIRRGCRGESLEAGRSFRRTLGCHHALGMRVRGMEIRSQLSPSRDRIYRTWQLITSWRYRGEEEQNKANFKPDGLGQWFSPRDVCAPQGHLAMSGDGLGCYDTGRWGWCYWCPVGRGRGCYQIPHSTQDRPHHNGVWWEWPPHPMPGWRGWEALNKETEDDLAETFWETCKLSFR